MLFIILQMIFFFSITQCDKNPNFFNTSKVKTFVAQKCTKTDQSYDCCLIGSLKRAWQSIENRIVRHSIILSNIKCCLTRWYFNPKLELWCQILHCCNELKVEMGVLATSISVCFPLLVLATWRLRNTRLCGQPATCHV